MKEIIKNYLSGKAVFSELQHLLKWLQQKEHLAEWKEVKADWMQERLKDDMDDQETIAWMKIKRSMHLTSQLSMQRKHIFYYKIVASFFLILSISVFLLKNQEPERLTSRIITDKAQISRVVLSDSTVVWLNSGSELSYENTYGVKDRTVRLKGEAFFQVKKNKAQPFHVLTGKHDVKVTGTSFMVSNYSNLSTVDVVLEEGSVNVFNQEKNSLASLVPDQKYTYDKNTGKAIVETVIPQNYTSWRYGTINFYQSTLDDIAKKLELKYNQPFVLSRNIRNKHFTFTLVGENLSEVLSIIEEISTIKATQANDTIYLK